MKEKKQNNVEIGIRRKEIAIIFIVIFIFSFVIFYASLIKEKKMDTKSVVSKKQSITIETFKPVVTPKVVAIKTKCKKIKLLQEHTVYHYSSYNRDNNLKVATNIINKTIVYPEEEFSFFDVLGKPSAEKGFKEAGVIINHQSATALGGGICEVATSLNTVVVNAGIKTNAQSHSLNVGYLNSTDHEATVTYDGGIDLKFKNTLKYPIMIIQTANGGNVTTKIFKVRVYNTIVLKNMEKGVNIKKKFYTEKLLAKNTIKKSETALSKKKYYYLNPNDFFEVNLSEFNNISSFKKIVKSLKRSVSIANLEIDSSVKNKDLSIKNITTFPVLVEISYNSKGEARSKVYKLKSDI